MAEKFLFLLNVTSFSPFMAPSMKLSTLQHSIDHFVIHLALLCSCIVFLDLSSVLCCRMHYLLITGIMGIHMGIHFL